MSELGWGPGLSVLILSWIVTLYSLWQMVEMHEIVPGKRFDRYHELGQHAFGQKLGLWIVVPQQLIVEVGVDIVYMITGVMSFCYSTVACVASIKKGVQPDVQYGYKSDSAAGTTFNFFSAVGSIVFAYGGHNIVMEVQATMPSSVERPSKIPMWTGVVVAYIVIALCYFPVAIIGYLMFGNDVQENILITLEKPKWVIAMANMFVVIHLIGSYQVYAMPVYDMMESVCVRKLNWRASWYLRFFTRNTYVAFTMLIAITFPFFDGLLGFFGGFGFAPTTYFLPCIIWLIIKKPKRFSLSWFANWFCIIFGVILMLVASIGGLRQIILKANTYKFYQ